MQEVQYKNNVNISEFFTGESKKKVEEKMDKRLDELNEQHGQPITVTRRRVGRNDPCPCMSGIKFKKCCLLKAR